MKHLPYICRYPNHASILQTDLNVTQNLLGQVRDQSGQLGSARKLDLKYLIYKLNLILVCTENTYFRINLLDVGPQILIISHMNWIDRSSNKHCKHSVCFLLIFR